jgi:hypothetical protein
MLMSTPVGMGPLTAVDATVPDTDPPAFALRCSYTQMQLHVRETVIVREKDEWGWCLDGVWIRTVMEKGMVKRTSLFVTHSSVT